ncbi:hypothetical protein [Spiroplasma endosymbiont of Thecophora atra]
MCKATGAYGHGANKIFINQYLGGVRKTREEMNATVRKNVSQLNRAVTKPNKSVISTVNKSQAVQGYGRYKDYGKQK